MLQLDDKAWRLLQALQADGRQPLKALAQVAGLSLPATAERIKRLEEAGVITGMHAEVSPAALGYGVRAVVGINVPQPGKRQLIERLTQMPEVLECHHVSGADSYLMTVVATDLVHLETLIASINIYGETRTSIVFSAPGLAQSPASRPLKRAGSGGDAVVAICAATVSTAEGGSAHRHTRRAGGESCAGTAYGASRPRT